MKAKIGVFVLIIAVISLLLVSSQSTNPWVSDSSGEEKNEFQTSDTIYIRSLTVCFPPESTLDLYIIDDKNLSIGEELFDVRGTPQEIKTDSQGYIKLIEIWENPIKGNYDVVLDCNKNGVYDVGEPVDNIAKIGFAVEAVAVGNVSKGARTPSSHTSFYDPEEPNKINNMLQIALTIDEVEDVKLDRMRLIANGTGNDLDVKSVKVYLDSNKNGKADENEIELGSSKFSQDNGKATIKLNYTLPLGTTKHLVIGYVLKNYENNNNKTFSFKLVELTGAGTISEQLVNFTGVPIESAVKKVEGTKSCVGKLDLQILPNTTMVDSSVIAFVSGFDNCSSEKVSIRLSSCEREEDEVCSCNLKNDNCNCNFIAPSVEGNYIIYGCIDKNGDGDFEDVGETGEYVLRITAKEEVNETDVLPEPEINETEVEAEKEGTEEKMSIQEQIILILAAGLILVLILLLIILIMLVKMVSKTKR